VKLDWEGGFLTPRSIKEATGVSSYKKSLTQERLAIVRSDLMTGGKSEGRGKTPAGGEGGLPKKAFFYPNQEDLLEGQGGAERKGKGGGAGKSIEGKDLRVL